MNKKGQTTFFIILGIVIVFVIFISIFFRSQIAETMSDLEIVKSEKVKLIENDISAHASDCLKKTTTDGLIRVLASGGYFNNAERSISVGGHARPYYLVGKTEYVPSLKEIARNLASYIDNNINPCLASYSADLKVGDSKSEVMFGKDVRVKGKQTLTLKQDEITARVKNFDAVVDANVKQIHGDALEFFEEVKNLTNTDLGTQGSLAIESKYEFFSPDLGDEDYVYIIYFNKSIEQKLDVEYGLALKYSKEQLETGVLGTLFDALSSIFGSTESTEAEGFEDLEIPDGEDEFLDSIYGDSEEEEEEEPEAIPSDEDVTDEELDIDPKPMTDEDVKQMEEDLKAMDEIEGDYVDEPSPEDLQGPEEEQ